MFIIVENRFDEPPIIDMAVFFPGKKNMVKKWYQEVNTSSQS